MRLLVTCFRRFVHVTNSCRVSPQEIDAWGKWAHGVSQQVYLLGLPTSAILAAAGCSGWSGPLKKAYWAERFMLSIPTDVEEKLKQVVFPFLAPFKAAVKEVSL